MQLKTAKNAYQGVDEPVTNSFIDGCIEQIDIKISMHKID